MRIITLNDVDLEASSVPEDQYNGSPTADGLYNPSTTYADGDVVYYTSTTPHKVYESLADSNQGNTPPDSPSQWGDLGATDRWRMFDEFVNTQTTDTSPLEVTVDANNTDTVGLFNLSGTSVTLTHIIDTELATGTPTLGDGWTDDSGNTEYDCDGTQTADTELAFSIITDEGAYYQVIFIVQNYSASNISAYIGENKGDLESSNGTYTQIIQSDGSSNVGIVADADFIGSIDYTISIKRLGNYETINLDDSGTIDWYYYFFGDFEFTTRLLWSYPLYQSATLKVSIENSTDAGCGIMTVGKSLDLGTTEYDAEFGILDYSFKATNETTGNTFLQQGNFADEGSFNLWLEYNQIDFVRKILIDNRAKASIYDFNNYDNTDPYLIIYGFFEQFRVIIPRFNIARCAIDIQGLI